MFAKKIISLKAGLLTAGAVLAMLALGPYAGAQTIRINFSAAAGSGYADLTVVPDPDASSSFDRLAPNPTGQLGKWDPEGAQLIKNASGSFNGIAITGVQALNQATPPLNGTDPTSYESLPKSYSTIIGPVSTGKPFVASYDNLFYVNDSPLVCPPSEFMAPYNFSGGFLDIFGVMFTLSNGNLVGLWSDGIVPPDIFGTSGGLTYGLSVLTSTATKGLYTVSSSQFAGATASVPEPRFMWLFGAVLLGLFAWRRSTE